ncbi:hypothetical protein, partial [Enterobacter hormaechei]|uniref:hypothetical protein n=1 Tax=Enterobacter hormaechei TaxID=158836 RepID=UPI00197A841F
MNIKDKNVLFTIEWVSETKKDKVHADRYQAAQSQAQGQTLQSEWGSKRESQKIPSFRMMKI